MMRRPLALVTVTCLFLVLWGVPAWPRENQPPLRELQQAVRDKPQDPAAHYRLGVKYAESGYLKKAQKAFQQATRLKPDYAEAYYELGKVNGQLGDRQQAVEALKKATGLKSDDAKFKSGLSDAYNRLGLALLEEDRGMEAAAAFREAVRNNPQGSETARLNLGLAYAGEGRMSKAIESFQEVIRQNPSNPQAHYNMGVAYHLLGNNVNAYAEFLILRDLDPVAAGELSSLLTKPHRKSDAK